jgi:hypothetical protein
LGLWNFPIGVVLILVGVGLIRDGRRAQKSGVANIFLQWPNDISREDNPSGFWSSVLVATFGGYMLLLGGLFAVGRIFIEGIRVLIAMIP